MIAIDQKIKEIIVFFNLNNHSFAKQIGVTSTTIDSITTGRLQPDGSRKRTKPGYDLLERIISEFNIDPAYLFGKTTNLIKPNDLDNNAYKESQQITTVTQEVTKNVVYIPIKNRAEYVNKYRDPHFIEALPTFNIPFLPNGAFRCFEVQGNDMVRTFYDRDLVFGKYVEDLKNIKNGRIYIIISKNDGIVLKRVINRIEDQGTLILKSDNQDGNYPTYTINYKEIIEVWHITLFASKQMPEPINVYDRLHNLEAKFILLEEELRKNN